MNQETVKTDQPLKLQASGSGRSLAQGQIVRPNRPLKCNREERGSDTILKFKRRTKPNMFT